MWIERNGRSYRIRDLVGGQKVTLLAGFPTKTSARAAMVQLQSDAVRGEALVPRGGQLSLGEWLDAWWPSYSAALKPSSRVSAESLLRTYIRPAFGTVALADIDPLAVQRWVAGLLAGTFGRRLSGKTVRNAHGLLHKIFAEAALQRLIRANPCTRTGLPERTHYEARFLTTVEADRLLAATPEHWRPLIALLLGTGMRWGEAIGLKAGRVDLLGRRLMVVEQLQELPGTGELVYVTPKSRMSRRTVTFTAALAEVLVPVVAGKERDELVFVTAEGNPVRASNFRRIWRPACARAGLDGLRIHDLRHSHAAWLLSAGRPPTAVQRRLGHASLAVTSDIYGHLLTEADEGIMATLDDALPMIDFRGTVGESAPIQPDATRRSSSESAGQSSSRPSDQVL